MKTCKDCIHYDLCQYNFFQEQKIYDADKKKFINLNKIACKFFKDKTLVLDLPCKPISVMSDGIEYNTDVYCPYCGTNLSGLYGDEPTEIIQCYNCGNFLDNTKTITKEAAEQALKGGVQE